LPALRCRRRPAQPRPRPRGPVLKRQRATTTVFDPGPSRSGDPEEFLTALDALTADFARAPTQAVTTGNLEADVELVVDQFTDGLVRRRDARIADHIHIHALAGCP